MTAGFLFPDSEIPTILKSPGARLDYTVGWTAWLQGDTLASVTWAISPAGGSATPLVDAGHANTTKDATIWLTGGVVGTTYSVLCTVTTAAGRVESRTFLVKVVDR